MSLGELNFLLKSTLVHCYYRTLSPQHDTLNKPDPLTYAFILFENLLYGIILRNKTIGQLNKLSSIVLEIPNEAYTTQSAFDWLFTTQSRVLQADW